MQSFILGALCTILACMIYRKRWKRGHLAYALPRRQDRQHTPKVASTLILAPLLKGFYDAFKHLFRFPVAFATRPFQKAGGPWLCLDCKTAIGHDLARLALRGYRIYDNFPVRRSTVGHIAVGPNGVFTIETKGTKAPESKKRTSGALMVYDGRIMPSPVWVEAESMDQAQKHAKWLSGWLSSGVGQTVDVYPLLALPGWLTNRGGWGDVLLINKNDYELLTAREGTRLSPAVIERIDRQLGQRCRDTEVTGR